eukprot:13557743-Ditylum_brightwellii.AAC.1
MQPELNNVVSSISTNHIFKENKPNKDDTDDSESESSFIEDKLEETDYLNQDITSSTATLLNYMLQPFQG